MVWFFMAFICSLKSTEENGMDEIGSITIASNKTIKKMANLKILFHVGELDKSDKCEQIT